jgi:type II secretory pathway pseudopilin PulG
VVTLVGIIAAASIPPLAAALDRSRAQGAARFVQARMMLARVRATSRGAVVALRFTGTPEEAVLTTYFDRNRNGVRAMDITAGIDKAEAPGITLQSLFRGVALEPVTAAGLLFSFTPLGTSSSGTFYLTGKDGSRYAVRVLGATGRTRLLRYVDASNEWKDVE